MFNSASVIQQHFRAGCCREDRLVLLEIYKAGICKLEDNIRNPKFLMELQQDNYKECCKAGF